jgi:hypothetical protein
VRIGEGRGGEGGVGSNGKPAQDFGVHVRVLAGPLRAPVIVALPREGPVRPALRVHHDEALRACRGSPRLPRGKGHRPASSPCSIASKSKAKIG